MRGLTRRRFVRRRLRWRRAGLPSGSEPSGRSPSPRSKLVPLGSQPHGLPKRQHAWGDYLAKDAYGNATAPKFDRLLFFDVRGTPTPAHARLLESRLRTLERHFHWNHKGLLFTVSWGRATSVCSGSTRRSPKATRLSSFEHPAIDDYDVCIHLAER